jgi:uncharacterized protein (TIGR02594 family)
VKNDKGECFCKQKENQFYWSNQITCDERKKVLQVCAELWGEAKKSEKASELMAIFHLETAGTFKPSADNGKGFSGLIQFSDASADKLGTTRAKLKAMTFIEQMDYVKKYLQNNKNKLATLTDFYLQVIKPNAVGNGGNPEYVLFDESITVPDGDGSSTSAKQRMININREPWVTKYGYASNPPFMKGDEHTTRKKWVYTRQRFEQRYGFINGKTTIKEVTEVVEKEHYNLGKPHVFNAKCGNIKEEKKDKKEGLERAPWMKSAWEEEAKKLEETGKNEDIQKFFDGTAYEKSMKNNTTNEQDVAWCAAFINWIMKKHGYTGITTDKGYDAVRALKWANWNESKELKKPIYGAIAVKRRTGGGHVGFVAGKKGDKVVILGGNQSQKLQCVSYEVSDYFAYVIPTDYEVIDEDYDLKEYDGNPGIKGSEK